MHTWVQKYLRMYKLCLVENNFRGPLEQCKMKLKVFYKDFWQNEWLQDVHKLEDYICGNGPWDISFASRLFLERLFRELANRVEVFRLARLQVGREALAFWLDLVYLLNWFLLRPDAERKKSSIFLFLVRQNNNYGATDHDRSRRNLHQSATISLHVHAIISSQ